MINIETIYNLIVQDLVKEHDIPRNNKILSLMATNEDKLYLYKQYQVAIETHKYDGSKTSTQL